MRTSCSNPWLTLPRFDLSTTVQPLVVKVKYLRRYIKIEIIKKISQQYIPTVTDATAEHVALNKPDVV